MKKQKTYCEWEKGIVEWNHLVEKALAQIKKTVKRSLDAETALYFTYYVKRFH
ncbi:hypothetical protein [Bacillus atrophaeus]|uniref:hypothetical protein n=1 Tax=Bacillus atrophaeus TaxID=1452 RepID=UPI0016711C44|nr:hypothetical protein [Bacillus atrophaeus]